MWSVNVDTAAVSVSEAVCIEIISTKIEFCARRISQLPSPTEKQGRVLSQTLKKRINSCVLCLLFN
jgi:hypothetical protein